MSNYLLRNNDFDFVNDDFLHDFFGYSQEKEFKHLMKTDVVENENDFSISIDLPGYCKEDIKISVEKGYLIVEGRKETKEEEKKEKYLRRERFYGTVSRTYYLGDKIKEEDIKANFKDGVLNIIVPKYNKQEIENKKYIAIE